MKTESVVTPQQEGRIKKKKTNAGKKYQQRVSLYGVPLNEAVADLLKSPPLPKKKQKRKP
jgi:hypothetical protein